MLQYDIFNKKRIQQRLLAILLFPVNWSNSVVWTFRQRLSTPQKSTVATGHSSFLYHYHWKFDLVAI